MRALTGDHELEEKMRRLGIHEKDIICRFIRSGGPGGQKVNKTSSCVYLKHGPTGMEVKSSRERSQSLNRYSALVILVDKIEKKHSSEEFSYRQAAEKKKRAMRKRPKALKEKILESKRKRSEKKASRRKNNFTA
ncbi:MAG: peptide chain release factor-like protein [Candidatus Omnitrophica bacterium]|nr:peptide chain release factor-like protein [Candidatus Omnitrophota bacterium]